MTSSLPPVGGEGEEGGDNADAENDDSYGGEQETEQSGTLDADGKLQISVPTRVDSKKQDLVYRIEARVTDAGNREIAGHGFALATYGSFFLTAEPNSYVYTKGSDCDCHRYRAGLRQEAGADYVSRGDESLGLAERCGPGCHHVAGPDRRQR